MQIQSIQALSNFSIHNYKQSVSDKKNKITFGAKEAQLEKLAAATSEDLFKRIDLWKNQTKQGLKEIIQTMADNGYTEKEMSRILGIFASKIKSITKEFGLKINKKSEAKLIKHSRREELLTRIQMLGDEGLTRKEIAKQLNLSATTISYYIKNFNIKFKTDILRKNAKMSKEEYRDKLQEMVDKGYTYTKMSKELKSCRNRISRDIKNFGIKFNTLLRGGVRIGKEEYYAKLQQLANEGIPQIRIAEEMHSSMSSITNDLKNLGIKKRDIHKYSIGNVQVSEEEFRAKLQQLANEGMSQIQMAEEIHTSLFRLNKYLKKFDMKKDMNSKVKTTIIRDRVRINKEEYQAQLKELTEQGLDAYEISLKLKIPKLFIMNDLKNFGIKRNSRNYIHRGGAKINAEGYRAKLQDLADRGFSRLEIAQELNLSYGVISSDLKRFGIKAAQGKHKCANIKSIWAKLQGQN